MGALFYFYFEKLIRGRFHFHLPDEFSVSGSHMCLYIYILTFSTPSVAYIWMMMIMMFINRHYFPPDATMKAYMNVETTFVIVLFKCIVEKRRKKNYKKCCH
jgi:hypothetical protein